jgi:hypothetical protein
VNFKPCKQQSERKQEVREAVRPQFVRDLEIYPAIEEGYV